MEKIIYTADLLSKFNLFLGILIGVGWTVFVIYLASAGECGFLEDDEKDQYQHKEFIKAVRRLLIIFSTCFILTMLDVVIPSKKVYLRMHAAEVIEEYQENSYWKKSLSEDEVHIINEWIKENEQSK
jgi:hypothetical protein